MPKRKVEQTVILHRESGRVRPSIGEIFDFSEDEIAQIQRANPDALSRPVVSVDVENEEAQAKAKAEAEAQAKAAGGKGGKGGKGTDTTKAPEEEV